MRTEVLEGRPRDKADEEIKIEDTEGKECYINSVFLNNSPLYPFKYVGSFACPKIIDFTI